MDGLNLKPTQASSQAGYLKSRRSTGRPVASPDLPETHAVNPAEDGAAQGRYHAGREAAAQHSGLECIIDPEARDVIYRAVDVAASEPATPSPTDAARTARAYATPPADQDDPTRKAVTKTA